MFTKFIKAAIVTTLVAFILPVAGVNAQPPDGCDEGEGAVSQEKQGKMERKHKEMFEDLGLSEEQKKLLEENKTKNHEKMKAVHSSMKEKRKLLHEELKKDELDMAAITGINNEMKALEAQMSDDRLAGILEVRKILTKEQFKKFSAKMDQMRKSHKGKGGPGGGAERSGSKETERE